MSDVRDEARQKEVGFDHGRAQAQACDTVLVIVESLVLLVGIVHIDKDNRGWRQFD